MKCVFGRIAVILITADQHAANPDLKAWLSTCEARDLHGNPAGLLDAGDALFVPLGCIPLFVVLPNEPQLFTRRPRLSQRGKPMKKGAAGGKDFCQDTGLVGLSMLYEICMIEKCSDEVRAQLHADQATSAAIYPKKLKQVPGVAAWLTKLPPPAKEDVAH